MDCVFCQILDGTLPSEMVMETEDWVAFRDIQPSAPSHLLIVPRRHIATLNDLNEEDVSLMGRMLLGAHDLAQKEGIDQSGYRLVINCNEDGGQIVFHLHMHLLGGKRLRSMC